MTSSSRSGRTTVLWKPAWPTTFCRRTCPRSASFPSLCLSLTPHWRGMAVTPLRHLQPQPGDGNPKTCISGWVRLLGGISQEFRLPSFDCSSATPPRPFQWLCLKKGGGAVHCSPFLAVLFLRLLACCHRLTRHCRAAGCVLQVQGAGGAAAVQQDHLSKAAGRVLLLAEGQGREEKLRHAAASPGAAAAPLLHSRQRQDKFSHQSQLGRPWFCCVKWSRSPAAKAHCLSDAPPAVPQWQPLT